MKTKNFKNLNGFRILLLLSIVLLGVGNAWATTHSTHYGKATVSKTGEGSVYLATSQNATSGNTTETWNCGGSSGSDSKTYYAFAKPATGWAFKAWSGDASGTDSPYALTFSATSTSSSSPTTKNLTANFVKVFQFKAKADLATGSAGLGDVCVNFTNGTPAYQASAMTATTTQNGDDANTASKTKTAYFYAQKHTGAEFRGWYSDAAGTNKVSDNASYSANITSSVIAEPASPQLTYYAKFEKVETTPYWSLYGVAGTSKTLQIGETIDLVTETAGNTYSWGTPSYVDAGETNPVMTYNSSTKTFTANRAGTVTVTFTQAAGEDANGVLWKAGSETFTFTVNKLTPQFTWADPLPNFIVGTNLAVSNLFSFTPAECEQNWTLTSSDPTNLPSIATPATALSLPKEANGVTLTFHQDATWKWNEIANTSIKINVTKEPVEFNWKNPSLIAGNTYSWTDFVETNSAGAWNLVSEDESVIPTMRSIASTSATVAAGMVTLTFTQGQDLGHDAVPVQTKTFTVYPADGLATFKVGNNTYTTLTEANSVASSGSNKTIIVARDGVLPPGDYTISSGVSLLVPYSTSTSLQTSPATINGTANATAMNAYRKLTFADGANVVCNGNIYVGGQACAGNGGNPSGYVTGDCGVIDMSAGGHIELNGTLYCWGFIRGQGYLDGNNTKGVGTITANSGATIWEDFSVGDWRGGTATTGFGGRFFPFQSYFIQNIEIPVTYKYGSTLKNFFTFNMSSSAQTTTFTLVGSGNGNLFKLTDSKSLVRKWYDPTTDLMCYELSGTAVLDYISLKISYATINSSDYDLPINSNMHIILTNCNMTLNKPMIIQPSAIVEIKEDANVTIATKIYMYDKDEWGPWISSKYYRSYGGAYPILTPHMSRGDGSSNQDMDDATFMVDGTLTVSSGGLYTSAGGANVMGNGGGKAIFSSSLPSSTTVKWYKGTNTSGSGETGTTAMTAANLCNENATYTKSLQNTFYNIHGRWFVSSAKDENTTNHTYSFTYLDNGNTGSSVTTPAVYASDKTGLMAGYKWVNVALDNTFCGSKTYRGEDGHYYYYNSASTDAVSKWVQLVKLNDALYSGSDNNLYTFTGNSCLWASVGEIDENCMYTIDGVKKALVGTEFVELEKDEYDEVYVKVTDHSDYYMLFDGCVWQHATKIPDTYRAYEVLGNPYIWLNDEWTEVTEASPYYYTTDDQNIKHYYEFDNVTFSWVPVKEKVRISTSTERKDFLTWDDAMLYLGQYVNPTVTLLEDAVATKSVATLAPNSKSTQFTIDLNGHTLTANIGDAAYFMNMNTTATLYITDTSDKENGQMLIYGAGNKVQQGIKVTKGKVEMNGGRIYMENAAVYASNTSCQARVIHLEAGQELTINGGELEAKAHRNAIGVYGVSSAATATTSKITMNGGSVKATAPNYAYGILSYGIINMNDGIIDAKTAAVTSAGGTTAAGAYAYGIYATVSSNATASNCYYATVNMIGGQINATAATSTAHGISAQAGQTVASSVSNYNPSTNKASAKLNITGGEINAKCLTNTTAYGVYAVGTENSNGSNASGAHIIKNCKITASATGTAYGVIMSASLHDLSGIALTGVAEIENVDIFAETTTGSTAAAVYATATSNFMSRAKYNYGTNGVSAANKKLWFIDANNNDGDLTHEAIAVSGDGAKKTYRCHIGGEGAGAKITIKSGTFKAKSGYQYAYGAYANRSLNNYDGTVGSAEITIIDGTFSAETAAEYAWCLRNAGVMTVKGGTFNALSGTAYSYGVYAEAGTTTIDGGIFNLEATTSTTYGVCATGIVEGNTGWKHRGEVVINGGTFNAHALGTTTAAGVYATGTYAELYQTKYDARTAANKELYYPVDEEGNKLADATKANYYPYKFGVHTISGKITVNGGTFNAKAFTTTAIGASAAWSNAVRADMIDRQGVARGEIIIHDGEFNSETETSSTAEGVRSYGTVYVDGGTFNIKSKTSTAYGVRVLDGTTTVDGGTFNVKAGTDTSIGVRTECSYNTEYGYCGVGEAIINGGTFNVNTWGGSTAYGVQVTGTTGAFSATKSTSYTGTKPTDYAYASNATIKGGTFITNPSNGTSSYGIVVEATKTRGSETAYPKCEVNGGFFQMKGNSNSVYACGTSATEDAEGNPNLAIKGGHFSTNVNLSQSGTKNPVRTPYNIIACVHPEYKATYPHEVTEAYTITFKDDDDNTLWSGLQPKGSTAVYPLTNGTPEKTPTSTNSFEFASWNTPLAEVTGDATYIANFTAVAKKFMVTWKDDKGVEIDHMEYASGQTPTHADPDKEGYTFTGWTPAITAVGAADQVYSATFSINQYTIRWEDEDGTLISEDVVNHGTIPTKPANPTKEGYSFQAWNPGVVKATEDATYTATYLLNLVTLKKANSTTATPYVTFAAALAEANKADGGTLTLLQDVKVAGSSQSFTKTMMLDLSGHTLRGAVNKLINVNGSGKTVTVKDSKGGGMIEDVYATNGQLTAVYVTNGTFVLESGTIRVENPTTSSSASYYAAAVLVPSGKTFRMEGGTLESVVNVDYAYGVYNLGTTILNHGTINTYAPARSYGIRADNTTTINNDDVIINANATRTTYGVAVWNNVEGKTITINGGTFNGIATTTTGYAIHATTSTTEPTTFSTINVNGGKFKSTTKTVLNTSGATIHLNAGFYDTDTELAGLASPKQVVGLTTEPEKAEGYNYKIVDDAHQITFKNEDGSVVLQQSNIEDGVQPVYAGEAQTKASTPKYAYDFDGWKDASDDQVYAENELPVVSQDAVYTAHFSQSGVEYPITFANIDGMGTDYVQMVAYDEVPVYDGPAPYMSGAVSNYAYTFIGWDPEPTAVTGAATYTPRYDLVISHNVSFVINNVSATTPAALTVAEGAAVERPADQLVNCQHIAGWYTDGGLTEEWDFANDKMGESDLILYAKWETKTYTITWLDEFGDGIDQTTVDCGMVPAHADLYKPSTAAYSYDWKGWNKTIVAANANATYKSLGFTQVPKRYAITFVTGSGATVINPIEQEVGSIIEAPADPTREGYTFNGWLPAVPSTMPAEDVECVAQWTLNIASVAVEGEPTTYHASVADAITAANGKTNATVTMLQNAPVTSEVEIIATMTIDLNGKTISSTETAATKGVFKINAPGKKVTITDSGTGGKISHKASCAGHLYGINLFAGSLNVEDGYIYAENTYATAASGNRACGIMYPDNQTNPASITMSGGTVEAKRANNTYVYGISIYTGNCGLTMTGGTVIASGSGAVRGIYTQGTAELTDVTVTATAALTGDANCYAVFSDKNGNYTINSGTYTATSTSTGTNAYAISLTKASSAPTGGSAIVKGGRFSGKSKELNISGGTASLKGGYYVHETDLADKCATNYSVFSLTGQDPYKYEVAEAYTVTFNANGHGTAPAPQLVEKGQKATAPADPTAEGYTFGGWYKEAGCTNAWNFASDVVTAATPLYAQWTVIPYTITFNSNGGSDVASITQNYGTAVTAPAAPTREGYTFNGWSPAVPSTMPVNGLTCVAQWTVNPYTITFDSNGGSSVASITQNYGTAVTAPADPTREGYTFNGWSPAVPSTMPVNGLTCVAQWTVNPYTITFDSNGGSAVASITQNYGTAVTAPADPTREGYTFNGWSPAVPSTMPVNGLTCVAQWTVNPYTITFDSNGGSSVASITQNYGTAVTAPADPTREGYTFNGWSPAVPSTMPVNGLTCVAQWTINQYTLTLEANHADWGTVSGGGKYDYNTPVTITATPKAGFKFVKWNDDNTSASRNVTVTADVTYTATFDYDIANYTVKHWQQNIDNDEYTEVVADRQTNLSGTIGTLTNAVAKSYTGFDALSFDQETIAVSGTEVNIRYNRKTYLIKWEVTLNGEQEAYKEETLRYGAMPSYGETPTKESSERWVYTFSGWSPKPYAVDKAQEYSGSFHVDARPYLITFVNDDNTTVLQSSPVVWGSTPEYTGSTPVSTIDASYEFIGWTPAITAVAEAATYVATYKHTVDPINVVSGDTVTINMNTVTTTTTVHVAGELIVEDGKTLSTNDLILEASAETSGEIVKTGAIKADNIYFDLILNNPTNRRWNAFTVPFRVDLRKSGKPVILNGETLTLGRGYDIVYYDGSVRAAQGKTSKCWKYVEDGDSILDPGRAYMIASASRAIQIVRFTAAEVNKAFDGGEVHVDENPSTTGNVTDGGWNGIGNPMMYHSILNAGVDVCQVHDGGPIGADGYHPYDMTDKKFVVGKAAYVQVNGEQNVGVTQAGNETVVISERAPRRSRAEINADRFDVTIAPVEAAVADRIFVLYEENKADEYIILADVAKAGVSTVRAQMWVDRYGEKLCKNTTALIKNRADYPLGIYAPQSGEYEIFLNGQANENANLYLTYDGKVIWNLNYGGYTASLEAGTNTRYGLRLVRTTSAVVTGIEEATIENGDDIRKVIVEDKVYIIRNGEIYSVTGQKAQ